MIQQVPLLGSVATGFGTKEPDVSYAETSKGLKEASKDFTSILFSQMFSVMRGNPDDKADDEEHGVGGGMFSGDNLEMFIGFLDQEIGKKFAEQGGNDMVNSLYAQLKGHKVFSDDKTPEAKNKNPLNLTKEKV